MLVTQLNCELRVTNYSVSGYKIDLGFGKCNTSILKCSELKTEKYRIQNCTCPAMLPAGDKDEMELVKCLAWGMLIFRLRHVKCRRGQWPETC